VIDTAHNPASARALIATLAELPPATRRTLIVSISHDKDVPAVVRELAPHFERIIVTQYQDNPRAVPVGELSTTFAESLTSSAPGSAGVSRPVELLTSSTPSTAWHTAVDSATLGERICIAGSFFLAAEMRPMILQR
jgi:dihydrofolate synthase/folylpolyglutamate synthase